MNKKEIKTRHEFKDLYEVLSKVNFENASVKFREASYNLKQKIKVLVIDKEQDIFKLQKEVESKVNDYRSKIYEAGKQFAVKNEKNEPIITNNSYNIDVSNELNVAKWNEVKKTIDEKYKDAIEAFNKNEKERIEWLSKKISITINKMEDISDIPKISDEQDAFDKGVILNKNTTFDMLVQLFTTNEVKLEDDDGKEVEETSNNIPFKK